MEVAGRRYALSGRFSAACPWTHDHWAPCEPLSVVCFLAVIVLLNSFYLETLRREGVKARSLRTLGLYTGLDGPATEKSQFFRPVVSTRNR